jgi:hypothetical protein
VGGGPPAVLGESADHGDDRYLALESGTGAVSGPLTPLLNFAAGFAVAGAPVLLARHIAASMVAARKTSNGDVAHQRPSLVLAHQTVSRPRVTGWTVEGRPRTCGFLSHSMVQSSPNALSRSGGAGSAHAGAWSGGALRLPARDFCARRFFASVHGVRVSPTRPKWTRRVRPHPHAALPAGTSLQAPPRQGTEQFTVHGRHCEAMACALS